MSTIIPAPVTARRMREADLEPWIRSGAWRDLPGSSAPALPVLATEFLQLAADPDVAQTRVATVVCKDPVLATRVLGFANSAAVAAAVTVTTLQEAIMRLGTRTVCNIALADQVAGSFQDRRIYGPLGQSLRDHSLGTAYVAYLLSEVAGMPSDEAFLCGLMHDIGKLYVLKLVHDVGLPSPSGTPSARILQLVADTHAEAGGYLLDRWGLPEALQDPVVWHHEPWRAARQPRVTSLTYAANRLAHRYGFGAPRDEAYDPLADSELQTLGVDEAALAHIDARAPGLFDVARRGMH